jgi:hypothetical protein
MSPVLRYLPRERELAMDYSLLDVPLDSFRMRLRPSELEAVAAGLGAFDTSEEGDLITLAEALRRLPLGERAATWELAVRRYAHHKPLTQAAGEIGLDEEWARSLLKRFDQLLAEVPVPEQVGLPDDTPSSVLESSSAARVMSAEMLGNAIAHHERVNLDEAHEASMDMAAELREQDRHHLAN